MIEEGILRIWKKEVKELSAAVNGSDVTNEKDHAGTGLLRAEWLHIVPHI